jgi:hypothetical protein
MNTTSNHQIMNTSVVNANAMVMVLFPYTGYTNFPLLLVRYHNPVILEGEVYYYYYYFYYLFHTPGDPNTV